MARKKARYGTGPRRVSKRPVLPVVVVVCDDSRTAPAYFDELKQLVKPSVALRVVPCKSSAGKPGDVVQRARDEFRSYTAGRDRGDRTAVWVLIDPEHAPADQGKADEAKAQAANLKGIRVALSKPCFEVWTLLHLKDTGANFADCAAVISNLAVEWRAAFSEPFENKAQADYRKLLSRRREAAKRAERHWKQDDGCWTEVFKVVNEIDGYAAAASADPPPPPSQTSPPSADKPRYRR